MVKFTNIYTLKFQKVCVGHDVIGCAESTVETTGSLFEKGELQLRKLKSISSIL